MTNHWCRAGDVNTQRHQDQTEERKWSGRNRQEWFDAWIALNRGGERCALYV
jgi:hypothetical protein